MSGFQNYEFVAIERLLSAMERKRLREITSRDTTTSTRLVNTYEWGNFKADPRDLVCEMLRPAHNRHSSSSCASVLPDGRHADKGEHEELLISGSTVQRVLTPINIPTAC